VASSPAGKFRPWTYIGIFTGLVVLLYGLVALPGSKSPKLGIDLQGGTRITLTAQTLDQTTPSRESMNLARTIMETRVNGAGVTGAQVQLDGSTQLVVTVPGQQTDLGNLARSARMNIRPLVTSIPVAPPTDVTSTGTTETSGSTTGSGSSSSGSRPGSSSPAAPSTQPAIGETLSNPPSLQPDVTPSESVGPAPSEQPASSPAGLRGGAAAASTPSAAASSSAASSSAGASSAPSTGSSGAAASGSGSGTGTGTGTVATGTAGVAGAKEPAWPQGSDPKNPTQPKGSDAAAITAWQTAATSSLNSGAFTCKDLSKFAGLDDPAKPLLACDQTNTEMFLLEKTLIPGDQIDTASAGIDTNGGGWGINVAFKSQGFGVWSAYTTGHVGTRTSFTLDGEVLSAPSIQGPINTPTTRVSGSFNQTSATSLANSLKFGALPLQFKQDKTENVSAQVGADSLRAGLIAGGIGLLLVVLYCLLYYRLLGVITILSLVLSGLLVYAVMVLLGRWIDLSLDMPGVAGLIIAIGITADSFVIYFERLKDEVREGRTFRSAVPRGWERAKRTILSADAVTFLSAVILYFFAVGEVKGFAFTLGLSTVLDLVVVFLVTHPLLSLAADSPAFRSPRLSGLGAVAAAGARHRATTARLATKEA